MKRITDVTYRALILCLLVFCYISEGYPAGLLTPKDGSLPALEIKSHKVKVVIEDGYAVTTVNQIFHNPHSMDLEAIYSFPVPEKGAVSEFTMWIDNKPIHGEVLKKEKAREVYDRQKAAGKEAGITEKDSHKTFDISVSPVRAGQDTRIRLSYIQPAKVDTSMGKYLYPLEEGGVDEAELSFWTANEQVTTDFSFDLIIRSSYPVDGIRLPNHPNAQITQNGDEYHIHLGNSQAHKRDKNRLPPLPVPSEEDQQEIAVLPNGSVFSLDQDIVVYYRHADNLPGAVEMVAYKPEKDKRGTFMLTVTPAMDLKPITEGRDWIFVLDISGSMQGKYHTLAEGVSQALGKMSPADRFRIVLFNDKADELTTGYTPATPQNVGLYIELVKHIQAQGSTNVYDGLKLGLKKLDNDRTSAILLVTDGVANVGVTEQKSFIELIEDYDVRLFTFIMGNSADRPLLTALTDASNGFFMSVSNSDDIVGSILLAQSKVTHEALHGATVKIKGIRTFDLTPEKAGSLYRGRQLIILGRYYGSGEAEVSLSGKISGQDKLYRTSFNFPDRAVDHPELERLWAYAKIEDLMREMESFGEKNDLKDAVTDLGIEYGLVTDYTSMVVVRDEVFKQLGIDRRNRDRLQQEYDAGAKRSRQQVTNRRVDTAQPMFNAYRPTTGSSGGGAGTFDGLALLLLAPLVYLGVKKNS